MIIETKGKYRITSKWHYSDKKYMYEVQCLDELGGWSGEILQWVTTYETDCLKCAWRVFDGLKNIK